MRAVLTPLSAERADQFAAMAQEWADHRVYDYRPSEQARLDRMAADWQEMADYFRAYAKAARGEKPS